MMFLFKAVLVVLAFVALLPPILAANDKPYGVAPLPQCVAGERGCKPANRFRDIVGLIPSLDLFGAVARVAGNMQSTRLHMYQVAVVRFQVSFFRTSFLFHSSLLKKIRPPKTDGSLALLARRRHRSTLQ